MNLWSTIGLTPQAGIAAAVAGLVAAVVVAVTVLGRRSRTAPKDTLGLHDR